MQRQVHDTEVHLMTWRRAIDDPLVRTMTKDRGAHGVTSHIWLNKLPGPHTCMKEAWQGQEQTLSHCAEWAVKV